MGSYTFNIIAYDKMIGTTTPTYLLSGKFTCTYEDRTGIYALRPSQQITNKLILDYKVGDKLIFKNTALTTYDYLNDVTGLGATIQRWGKLTVFKIANGTNWSGQGEEAYMTKIFEWRSETNQLIDYTQAQAVFPWATTMRLTMEAGFRYFIIKWWHNVDANYHITPASEDSQMNVANYGGQGFKMITTYAGSAHYVPQTPSAVPVMTSTSHGVAGKGARLTLDTETATLSADIPTSADLITNMKAEHFVNNVTRNKIEISSVYVSPNATKLATGRTIGGTSFDGSANISVGLADTATKLATARTIGGTSFDGTGNISVGLADTATKLATTRAIAGVNFDGTGAIAIPYFNLTNKPTAGTGIAITAGSATLSP